MSLTTLINDLVGTTSRLPQTQRDINVLATEAPKFQETVSEAGDAAEKFATAHLALTMLSTMALVGMFALHLAKCRNGDK